jgi:hypothetical protein
MMKSEREEKTINYAVALRAKCYYTDMAELKEEYRQKEVKKEDEEKVKKQEGRQEIKKVKGVTKPVKETMLMGVHYVTSLLANTKVIVHNQTRIQCKDRKMYTIQESKLALSADDTKRYITDNIIRTRAIGHYLNRLPINE